MSSNGASGHFGVAVGAVFAAPLTIPFILNASGLGYMGFEVRFRFFVILVAGMVVGGVGSTVSFWLFRRRRVGSENEKDAM